MEVKTPVWKYLNKKYGVQKQNMHFGLLKKLNG